MSPKLALMMAFIKSKLKTMAFHLKSVPVSWLSDSNFSRGS